MSDTSVKSNLEEAFKNSDWSTVCAALMPHFNDYLARHSKNIFECETVHDFENVRTLPALYDDNQGIRKQVTVPMTEFTKEIDKIVDKGSTALEDIRQATTDANTATDNASKATIEAKGAADSAKEITGSLQDLEEKLSRNLFAIEFDDETGDLNAIVGTNSSIISATTDEDGNVVIEQEII